MKAYPQKELSLDRNETLAYVEVGQLGDKPTLLLVHGNMSSSIHFLSLIEKLEADYHLIAPDLAGFGNSSYNNEHSSLLDFAKDLEGFVRALNIDEFEVLGWSTGGGIALELAYLLPDQVSKVFMLSSVGVTGYPMFKKGPDFKPIIGEYLSTKEEIAADPVQVIPILNMYEAKDLESIRMVWDNAIYINEKPEKEEYDLYLDEIVKQRNLVDIDYSLVHFNITNHDTAVERGSNHIEGIKCPVVIIHGVKDLVVPITEARAAKEAFGKQAQLYEFEEGGHALVQDDMERLVEIIKG